MFFTLTIFSMKEWLMRAPLFTIPMKEKEKSSALHFLNEGVGMGAPLSTFSMMDKARSSALHFLTKGVGDGGSTGSAGSTGFSG